MKLSTLFISLGIVGCIAMLVVASIYIGIPVQTSNAITQNAEPDNLFGWKYPSVKFPMTGPNDFAYSDIRDPGGVPSGLPVRLQIPVIGVDTAIEDAFITPDGRMDVPSGSRNVAWFALGPPPGEKGSAVIGGHFGIQNGIKFVFYDLDKLKIGDKINILDDKGNTVAFVVRDVKLFERDADATTVFTSPGEVAHLNLITCEGVWNKIDGSYPKRRVVFADEVISASTVVPRATDYDAFPRYLSVGAQGKDVATLQGVLEQKGFLTMPSGVAKGYFGELTRVALAQYQARVGLPSIGVFGPQTKAVLIIDIASIPAIPDAGGVVMLEEVSQEERDAMLSNIENAGRSRHTFMRYVKSLYETPIDGIITSALLALLIFMSFKVIKLLIFKAK